MAQARYVGVSFNPRSREGATAQLVRKGWTDEVSTHAPVRERQKATLKQLVADLFQPTLP